MKNKMRILALLVIVIGLSLPSTQSWAHGGEEHVIGTVSRVTASSIVVKTTAGTLVTVAVAPESKFIKDKAAATISDLKVGARVVIHAKEPTEGSYVADTVEFATAKPKAAAAASH